MVPIDAEFNSAYSITL